MKRSERYRRRHHTVHGVLFPPARPVIVFLTVCTRHRHHWLATEECYTLLVSIWRRAVAWRVGRYVILPDHLHLFAGLGEGIRLGRSLALPSA